MAKFQDLAASKNDTSSIIQGVDTDVFKIRSEPGASHGHQSNLRVRTKLVSPRATPRPVNTIQAGIRGVVFLARMSPFHDAKVGPFAGRTYYRVSITRITTRDRGKFLGEFGLASLPNGDMYQLNKVVIVTINDQACLHIVKTTAFRWEIQLNFCFHHVVAAWRRFGQH